MIRRPPRSTQSRSSAASDVYKQRQTRPPYNRGQPLRAAPLRGKAGGDARRTRPAPGRLPRDTLQDSLSGHQGRLDHAPSPVVEKLATLKQSADLCSSNLNQMLSLIHISEPTRLGMISYAVFCLKKK